MIAVPRSETKLDSKKELKRQKESKRAQLKALEENSESLGVRSFTFAVEQLEDVLLKLIMSSEAAFEEVEHE